jgi:hypothetical protein
MSACLVVGDSARIGRVDLGGHGGDHRPEADAPVVSQTIMRRVALSEAASVVPLPSSAASFRASAASVWRCEPHPKAIR